MWKDILKILGISGMILGVTLTRPTDIQLLEKSQEDYVKIHGKYERVKTDKFETIEYKTPKGEVGYQILWEDDGGFYSKGFGVEADSRTWTRVKPPKMYSATSTK